MDRFLVVLAVLSVVGAGWALYARARPGMRGGSAEPAPAHVDPVDFGLDPAAGGHAVLLFTSPYCLACTHWREALETRGVPFLRFDVSVHGDLANRYGVRSTPLVLAVALAGGTVMARHADEPRPQDVDRVASLVPAAPATA